jgi:hypothetical protein
LGALGLWCFLEAPILGNPAVDAPPSRRLPVEDLTVAVFFGAIPLFGVLLGMVVGGYVERHAFVSIIGLAAAFGLLAFANSRGNTLLGTVFVVILFAWFGMKSVSSFRTFVAERHAPLGKPANPFGGSNWVSVARNNNLPIVVSNSVFFMEVRYYAPEDISRRVVYLADTALARHYDGMNTGDKLLLVYKQLQWQPVEPYQSFVGKNPHFLLCLSLAQPSWLLSKLIESGASLDLLSRDDQTLFIDVNLVPRLPLDGVR